MNVVYDLETMKNCFTFTSIFDNGKGLRTFEISSRKNETEEMLDFLRKVRGHGMKMVGFNNNSFDYPVLHYILEKSKSARRIGKKLTITAEEIHKIAMDLIFSDNPYKSIREEEVHIPQIDLFKIHHFDNKARATSLKILEARMLSDNIEDLPFDPNVELTHEQMDLLVKYNCHDVTETLKFYNESLPAIKFREELTKEYGFDCTNFNDTKIGKQYFIHQLEKAIPGSCYKMVGKRRVMQQTKRDVIRVKDILFDYLHYDRPEFKAVKEWFAKQKITQTKGVFSDILESDLGDVAKYAAMVTKRKKLSNPDDPKDKHYFPTNEHINALKKEYPMGWIEEKELKSPKGAKSIYWCWNIAETLNVVVDGFRYDYGTGGIHGCISPQVIHETSEYLIRDADVSSLYPNIAIANRVYPEHLTDKFCDIYEDVYNERKKHAKGTAKNAVMKLALNGVYGDSNNEYSPFYDPQYTMTITIGGQLLISMLVDRLLKIDGLKILMANTDGITAYVPREASDKYYEICKQWELDVNLNLEFVDYKALYQRDVNNYIWVKSDGKTKRKGAYEYEDLGWHQSQDALVIRKAVEHELLGKGSAEEFINKHDNKYDFLLTTKVPRSSKLVLVVDNEDIPQQNICRYFPSVHGGKLIKIMPPLKDGDEPRRLAIDKDYNVRTCNNIEDFDWDVDYSYYINEARKLIDPIKNGERTVNTL